MTADGLQLIEVAPGIDVERDVLAHMGFRPVIRDVAVMDARIYQARPMGLATALLDLRLTDRLSYDAERNILFANFEGMAIRSAEDIDSVRRVFDSLCNKVGRKLALIVNYDGFQLDEALTDDYFDMVAELQAQHYTTATRYTTSAFMRMKLGASLPSRNAATHIFETHAEASAFLQRRPHAVIKAGA